MQRHCVKKCLTQLLLKSPAQKKKSDSPLRFREYVAAYRNLRALQTCLDLVLLLLSYDPWWPSKLLDPGIYIY